MSSKIPSIPITEHDINYGTKAGQEWQKGNSNYYLKPTGLPLKKAKFKRDRSRETNEA